MQSLLIRNRLPVLHYPIYTAIPPTPGQQRINITQIMPTQVGLIYGISIDTNGVTPNNVPLITTQNSADLYLTLRQGSSDFILDLRLINALFIETATVLPGGAVQIENPYRFLSVNIPGDISLDQSYYSNPTTIVPGLGAPGLFIKLNLWYCTWANLKYLESKGAILPQAAGTPSARK